MMESQDHLRVPSSIVLAQVSNAITSVFILFCFRSQLATPTGHEYLEGLSLPSLIRTLLSVLTTWSGKLPGSIQSRPCSDSEPCIHGHLGLHGAQPGPEPLVLVKTCHPPPYHPHKGTAQPQKLINILFIAFQSSEFQPFPRLGREICHTKMCFIDMKINLDWLLFFN